jgi:hypothetical protein
MAVTGRAMASASRTAVSLARNSRARHGSIKTIRMGFMTPYAVRGSATPHVVPHAAISSTMVTRTDGQSQRPCTRSQTLIIAQAHMVIRTGVDASYRKNPDTAADPDITTPAP